MRRSEELIAEARRRMTEKEGIRVKVRICEELKRRAEKCAEAVEMALCDWVNASCLRMKSGDWNGVAWEEETQKATRDGSEALWVRAPKGMNAGQVRLAMGCGVVVAERALERVGGKPAPWMAAGVGVVTM